MGLWVGRSGGEPWRELGGGGVEGAGRAGRSPAREGPRGRERIERARLGSLLEREASDEAARTLSWGRQEGRIPPRRVAVRYLRDTGRRRRPLHDPSRGDATRGRRVHLT